jgi:hypothetical protein
VLLNSSSHAVAEKSECSPRVSRAADPAVKTKNILYSASPVEDCLPACVLKRLLFIFDVWKFKRRGQLRETLRTSPPHFMQRRVMMRCEVHPCYTILSIKVKSLHFNQPRLPPVFSLSAEHTLFSSSSHATAEDAENDRVTSC